MKEIIESTADIKNFVYIDNLGVHDPTSHPGWVLEKGLIVDISSVRDMIDCNEIIVGWIDISVQLDDVLTK